MWTLGNGSCQFYYFIHVRLVGPWRAGILLHMIEEA
jgi:hypothetical protein